MPVTIHRRLLLAIACSAMALSPALGAEPPPSGSPEVFTYLNGLAPAERLAVLEREAKREGRVVVYGALGIDFADSVLDPFRKKYPEIKVDFVRLREPELVERTNMEARVRRVGGDVAISNVPWLQLLKGSLAGYVPTTWGEYDKGFLFGSAEEGWTAMVYTVLPSVIAWRTDRVAADKAPKTIAAMADPVWRGRVGTTSHLESLIDGLETALGKAKADPLVDRLAALQNRLYPSMAALSDGLSVGEVDIVWNVGAHRPVSLKAQGAPVDFTFPDPLLGLGLTISVIGHAPHSYAGALLMEFVTQASTLETADKGKMRGGLIYGNRKGKYSLNLQELPPLTFFGSIDEARFGQLSRRAEEKFLRR